MKELTFVVVNKLVVMLFVLPEIKTQVDAMWHNMNKGVSSNTLRSIVSKHNSATKKTVKKKSPVSSSFCHLIFPSILT